MKNHLFPFITFLILLLTISCGDKNKTATYSEEHAYSSEFGDWTSKKVFHISNGLTYSAVQLPLGYYIKKQEPNLTEQQLDSVLGEVKEERLIEFRFQHETGKDLLLSQFTNKDYKSSVEYMAFKIKQDYFIETQDKRRIPCTGVHFERNFKIAPFKKALLYFDGIPPGEEIKLIYKDQLFGNGIFKFNLEHKPTAL